MADKQVPVVRTVVTPQGYARAVIAAWKQVGVGVPEKQAVAVIYAQWMVETGGAACWNWNIGNAKWTPGCGTDFMCLNGVWEGVSPATAEKLIAAGRAVRDPSPDHARAVGATKVSVIFPPPAVESRFRAYPDLATGMAKHLLLLQMRFPSCWPWVLGGNPKGCAQALGLHGYFTADAGVYGKGMQGHFDKFMTTSAYELALDDLREVQEAETKPDLSTAADEPTVVVHVDPSEYLQNRDDDPPPEAA